jgi:hypothetical protein
VVVNLLYLSIIYQINESDSWRFRIQYNLSYHYKYHLAVIREEIDLNRPTLARRFAAIGGKFHNSQDDLLQKHKFDKKYDARVTIFSKCIVAIDSVSIGLLFRQYDMVNIEWWNKISQNEPELRIPDVYSLGMMCDGFSQFLLIGFFHSFFSAIESAFRIYVRKLDPNACNKGTANFESIYNYLFKELKLQQRQDYTELLDLLRHIRNTIHNNGVYYHTDGKNKSVSKKGKQYMFEIGKPVKFQGGTLNFLLGLMLDILKMIEDVVYSSDIISRNKIIDPLVD